MIGRKKYELRICIPGERIDEGNQRDVEATLKTVLGKKWLENVGWLDDKDGITVVITCGNGEFKEICERIMNLRLEKNKRFFINWHEKNW